LCPSFLNFRNSGSAVCHIAEGSNAHVNTSTYTIKETSEPPCIAAPLTTGVLELTFQNGGSPIGVQIWELIFPTPSIPTGWFRIRNTATNATLAHQFTHIPPFLIPDNNNAHQTIAPCNMNCCNDSCDKATQWALSHAQLHAENYSEESSTSNYYVLTNRLTGGFLVDHGGSGGLTQVCCWSKTPTEWIEHSRERSSLWEVQVVAPPHIWEFRNRETRAVLAEVVNNQHVGCVTRSERDPRAYSQWSVESVGPISKAYLEYLSIAY